jgi:hypothetical protein
MRATPLRFGCSVAALAAFALAACTSNTPPLEQAAATPSMTELAIPSIRIAEHAYRTIGVVNESLFEELAQRFNSY